MNGAGRPLVIGTRGSALARAQAEMVEHALRTAWPDLGIESKIIRTSGDETARNLSEPANPRAGRKGMFTAEIERVLLAEEIDVAVHSAKDLPSEKTSGLEIGAVLPRAPVEDVLVMKNAGDFSSMRSDATVATGSVRRSYQLHAHRADLRLVELRGNVPTRLRKLIENDWDAVVLARAGLERLGFEPTDQTIQFEGTRLFTELLPCEDFVPAGGQGVVALQIKADDGKTKQLVDRINHAETFLCLRAEREFLRVLQGDCGSPVGVLATIERSAMKLRAEVFETESRLRRRGEVSGNPEQSEFLAAELIRQINGG